MRERSRWFQQSDPTEDVPGRFCTYASLLHADDLRKAGLLVTLLCALCLRAGDEAPFRLLLGRPSIRRSRIYLIYLTRSRSGRVQHTSCSDLHRPTLCEYSYCSCDVVSSKRFGHTATDTSSTPTQLTPYDPTYHPPQLLLLATPHRHSQLLPLGCAESHLVVQPKKAVAPVFLLDAVDLPDRPAVDRVPLVCRMPRLGVEHRSGVETD
jgi:hypothetical protein